jgi:hypothetical protein
MVIRVTVLSCVCNAASCNKKWKMFIYVCYSLICHNWPRICSYCRNHNQMHSSLWLSTGVSSGVGTAYPSGADGIIHSFSGVRVARSIFGVVFCTLLFLLLSSFILPLYCMSFYNLRLLITPLLSIDLSYNVFNYCIYKTKWWFILYLMVHQDFHIRCCSCHLIVT